MNDTKKIGKKGISLLIGIIVLMGTVILFSKTKGEDVADPGKDDLEQNTEATKEAIAFPYRLEEEGLEMEALFQYSGMNPDCNGEEGEDVGAIQFKNSSGQYLEKVTITMAMEDGTTLHFLIEDLPTDSSTMAFEVSNTTYDATKAVWEIDAETVYEEASLQEEDITVTAKESSLAVKNQTDITIHHLTVVYRCVMDDMYFGGRSYRKEISSLEGGKTTEVDTSECYFGEAAVVNIEKD